eukprot:TRINITY_DN390_c0_g1_i3.p1 TRINITY_DN390_c0_g1~~TRINITY_DN390_c0_g1_i3.p1  ORF type:complete len:165 (-),score=5.95 TRINITY_DN390_c0_g1_i3:335-829(-)
MYVLGGKKKMLRHWGKKTLFFFLKKNFFLFFFFFFFLSFFFFFFFLTNKLQQPNSRVVCRQLFEKAAVCPYYLPLSVPILFFFFGDFFFFFVFFFIARKGGEKEGKYKGTTTKGAWIIPIPSIFIPPLLFSTVINTLGVFFFVLTIIHFGSEFRFKGPFGSLFI